MVSRFICTVILALFPVALLDAQTETGATNPNLRFMAQRRAIADILSPQLNELLSSLNVMNIIPRDESMAQFGNSQQPVLTLPLNNLRYPDRTLYLFYLPTTSQYFLLQIQNSTKDSRGAQPELRLWSEGEAEILITTEKYVLLSEPSSETFRIRNQGRNHIQGLVPNLTPTEIITCIANAVGITLEPGSFINRLATLSCNSRDTFDLLLTALHCFSAPSAGPAALTSTAGCITGVAFTIACNILGGCATTTPPPTSTCVSPLTVNGTASENWTSACSSTHRGGSYAKFYTFSVTTRTAVQIDLTSQADAYLFLLQGTGTNASALASNDDGGGGTNSRIIYTLDPGNYTIEATTYSSQTTGSFLLVISTPSMVPPPTQNCTASSIPFNASVAGSWGTDCTSQHRAGMYARYYLFTLTSTANVQINLTSPQDAYLLLLRGSDRNGTVIASDDDGGGGTNSRITASLSAGTYVIEATTYNAATTGSFSISVAR